MLFLYECFSWHFLYLSHQQSKWLIAVIITKASKKEIKKYLLVKKNARIIQETSTNIAFEFKFILYLQKFSNIHLNEKLEKYTTQDKSGHTAGFAGVMVLNAASFVNMRLYYTIIKKMIYKIQKISDYHTCFYFWMPLRCFFSISPFH